MSIFEKSLEKGTGVFLHATSLVTENPLTMEAAEEEAKKLLYAAPEVPKNGSRRLEYSINDFDHDVRVMASSYPSAAHEVAATDRLVDEIIFDSVDSNEGQYRAAKIGAELLAISREHAEA